MRLRPESDSPWLRLGRPERRALPGWDAARAGRCVLHVRLVHPFEVARAEPALFLALDRVAAVRTALAGTCWPSVAAAIASSDDYSAARALGLALSKLRFDGLAVTTARVLPGPPGENLVLFGAHGAALPGTEVIAVDPGA